MGSIYPEMLTIKFVLLTGSPLQGDKDDTC